MLKIKGILQQNSPASKLTVLLGITCFTTLSSLLLWKLVTDGNSANIDSLKTLQLFQSIGLFVLPPFLLAYLCYNRPLKGLQLTGKISAKSVFLVAAVMILTVPLINLITSWNQQLVLPTAWSGLEQWMGNMEGETATLTERMVQVHGIQGLFYNLLLMALLPALGEELFFRGTLQSFFSDKKNAHTAIWVTAFIFSSIHLQFYGFLPRLLMGAFFGYLLVKSGTLWLPIVGHFTNNAMAVIFYYLKFNGYLVVDIDKIGTGSTLWVSLLIGASIIAGVVAYALKERKKVSA